MTPLPATAGRLDDHDRWKQLVMSKGDKGARVLQDATGVRYVTCLARIRSLRALAPLPMETSEGQRFEHVLDSFLAGVNALPDLVKGQTRCVTCLRDLTPIKQCTCC